MSITMCFVSVHYRENRFYMMVGEYLRRRYGVKCSYVSNSMQARVDGEKAGVPVICFQDHIESARSIPETTAQKTRAEIHQQLGPQLLRQLYLSDPSLKRQPENRRYEKTIQYFAAWRDMSDLRHFDYVVSGNGGELIRQTAYIVRRNAGNRMLFLEHLPFPALSDHADSLKSLCISDNNRYFKVDMTIPGNVPPEARERIDRFIGEFKRKRQSHVYSPPPSIGVPRIRKFVKEMYIDRIVERGRNDYFRILTLAGKALKSVVNMYLNRVLYKKACKGEKYVYFPLHVEGDYQLTNIAPHCRYQDYLVNMVADSLPYGWKLYVKEHPARIGSIPFHRLRQMCAREDVVLLSPLTNPHEIVENAAAVVTVNSTTGFEALLYRKPVVTLGESFYRNCGLTVDIQGFDQIAEAINIAIDPHYRFDVDRFHGFLYRAMSLAYEGSCIDMESEQSAEKVAVSIWHRLRKDDPVVRQKAVPGRQKV